MKNVTKIVIIALCAALSLSSCNRNRYTPEEEDQFIPIGFTAVSQAMVKAETADFPYDDFGVWGIARSPEITQPYVLWNSDSMLRVAKDQDDRYIPSSAAYWLVGYTYDFIAVAPWAEQNTTSVTSGNAPGTDNLTFALDLADQISAGNYTFDLLGAAAEREVTSRPTSPQELTFWHLFTKVVISAEFVDCEGGELTKIVLKNVDSKASYTLSVVDGDINVVCASNGSEGQETLTVEQSSFTEDGALLYLIPQDISDVEMYLDFTVSVKPDEDSETVKTVTATNYMVNLESNKGKVYGYNKWYNWKLTISPKFVNFAEPTVQPWVDGAQIPPVDIK